MTLINPKKVALAMALAGILTIKAQQIKTYNVDFYSVSHYGQTDTLDYMPILVNTNNNVVIAGNKLMSPTQYDGVLAAQTSNAVSVWANSFNPSNGRTFVTASCNDPNGNIYTVGGAWVNATNGIDYFLMKTDSNGNTLFTVYYNGPNSTTDVASAVYLDPNTNVVYVTGASDGLTTGVTDYATLAFDGSTGSQQWVSRYNHSNFMDVATGIQFDPNTNRVIVTGCSGVSFLDYDIATVEYDSNTGSQTGVYRTANPSGAGQDNVFGLVTDSNGSVYFAGTTYNGSNYDGIVQKLDSTLTPVWTKTIDLYGQNDALFGIALDDSLNVLVTGSSYLNPTQRELIVVKYKNNGTKEWLREKQATTNAVSDAEGLKIKALNNNQIFIGGNFTINGNQDVAILCFNEEGRMVMEKTYSGSFSGKDKFMDMTFEADNIFVSARSFNGTNDDNLVVQFKYKAFDNSVATAGSGTATTKYINNEAIIEFDKKALKMNKINNKEITFGLLNDFVADSTCDKITDALDPGHIRGLNARNLETRKIFYFLNEADSLSQTRHGNYVRVPEFYCNLLVKFPGYVNTLSAPGLITAITPDILNSQLNHVSEPQTLPPTTNDPDFSIAQGALHTISGYTAGHINVDSAWSFHTGAPHVKVGIYDNGVQSGHPDMQSTFPGYDFVFNANLTGADLDDHGTPSAGIIGAKRNNNTGIAGIAGGDHATSQPGVNMYDCKVCDYFVCTDAWLAPGIVKGAEGTNIGGYALDVMSLGLRLGYAYSYSVWANGHFKLSVDAINFASRNGVAMSCPKGNIPNLGTLTFPADFNDNITMSVGSNGKDGHWCKYMDNCTNASTQWGNIDFVAPGTYELIKSTRNNLGYQTYDGTSMATAHVSGATALMMSYRNWPFPNWDNIVHEDCEQILQRTATDLVSTYYNETPGYDSITGWGRLNINAAMKAINKNYYRFRHVTEMIGNTGISTATTLVQSAAMTWSNYLSVPTGTYTTEIYEKTSTINFTLLPSEQIIDWWPLTKECYGTKLELNNVDYERPNFSQTVTVNSTTGVLKTYYYRIPSLNIWMPYHPNAIRSAFTLYTYDPSGTVGLSKNPDLVNFMKFKIYPNPNTGLSTLEFASDLNSQLRYKVTNILGQVVKEGFYTAHVGLNTLSLDLSECSHGVYIFSIFDSSQELYKQKLIKQ